MKIQRIELHEDSTYDKLLANVRHEKTKIIDILNYNAAVEEKTRLQENTYSSPHENFDS